MRKLFCCLLLLLFLPAFALGENVILIGDETTARQFALCFFSNPFVDENVSEVDMKVKQIGEDYQIDVPANEQHGALMLRFDDAGVIRQYWNQEWRFPKLTEWDPGWTDVPMEEQDALCDGTDTFSRLLLSGRFYDLVALMRSDENEQKGIFTLLLNRSEAYLALRAEPLKLYGFLDTTQPESIDYGVAISYVNASVLARSAVAGQLEKDSQTILSTDQPFFNAMGSTAADGSPTPVWEVLVHVKKEERSDTYYVILNAETGEILQMELQEYQTNG